MKTYQQLMDYLLLLHETKSWRQIVKMPQFKGIPAGTLCSIAHGREPLDNHLRKQLDLPVFEPTAVCTICGIVHVKKCPHNITKPKYITEMSTKELLWCLENRKEF